jgi:polysaccharide biosynthesis transport protein
MADIVVIDAPPLLPVTDAAVLSALVDGVVVVAQWAKTTTLDAEDAAMTLRGVGANVVGVVMNGVRGPRGRRYYSGYEAKPSPVPIAAMRSRRRAG